MTGYETILYDKQESIAHISLNRPDYRNAYNIQMRDDFSEALTAVRCDDEVKALIISGQGRAFCAGADLNEFGTAPSQAVARRVRWQRDVWGQLNELTVPTIAAVHGYCIGSGVEIMLLCDIRIAAKDTVFGMPEVHLGMIPAAGGSQTLPRNSGESAALDLLLTGRRIVAQEALGLGQVTRIVPRDELLDTAWNLAVSVSQFPVPDMKYMKQAIREGQDLNLNEGLELEWRLARLAGQG
ncbi:MAG: enoyl-CoA hydratase/isomerase family protein [Chloroflexota bacterium]|nr:enoyl-CoA hydratase/isomerase family protein [Chloroflexota bacterium]